MITEKEASKLARYRVGDEDVMYRAMEMTEEQINARRLYMKNMLSINPRWKNVTDSQIDNMRLYRIGYDFLVEDEDLNEHLL